MSTLSYITSAEVTTLATATLQLYLPFQNYGRHCTSQHLLQMTLWVAVRCSSWTALFDGLILPFGRETARKAFQSSMEQWDDLDQRLNQALVHHLPRSLWRRIKRRKLPLAIDRFDVPYYGQFDPEGTQVMPGKRKDGTSRFHAYASIYVVHKGQQFTLAVMLLETTHTWKEIVKTLLDRVRKLAVNIELLLLDRGFFSADVIQYLKACGLPFVMPVIQRGRALEHSKGPSGTRVFWTWTSSGFAEYTLKGKRTKRSVKIKVAVRRFREKSRSGRKKPELKTVVYAYWGIPGRSLPWIKETYRKRFAIESSYRMNKQSRARTSSQDRMVRYFWIGVSLLLRNLWVYLHLEVLSLPRRGGRIYRHKSLTFQTLRERWAQGASQGWEPRDKYFLSERRKRILDKVLEKLVA